MEDQDWFEQNKPTASAPPAQSSGDWFADNSPSATTPPSAHPWLDAAKQVGKAAVDYHVGGLKGLAHTAENFGDFASLGLKPLAEHYIPSLGEARKQREAAYQPSNPVQNIGRNVEQAAEFMAPMGAEAAGAKLLTKAPTVARVLGRAVLSGLGAGAVTGVQTEDPKAAAKAAGTAGATSAALGAVGAMLPSAQKTATRLYGSALKPPPSLDAAERARIIKTGLNEGLVLNDDVVSNAQKRISDINQQISEEIANRSQAGVKVDPTAVAQETDRSLGMARNQVNPEADVAAVNASKQEFMRQHSVDAPYSVVRPGTAEAEGQLIPTGQAGTTQVPQDIPLAEAQRLKQGTYTKLKNSYGEQAGASREAQKDLARGLKNEIVKAFPEIAQLNSKESALLGLEASLERFAGREGNKQLIGLGTPMAAIAAHAAGVPVIPLTIVKSALEFPAVKSRLAIALSRAASNPAVGRATRAVTSAIPQAAAYSTQPNGIMPPPQ